MLTSEVLNRAADLIEEHGWGQGPDTWRNSGQGLCIEGGIIAALGVSAPMYGSFEFLGCPAYAAVAEHLASDAVDTMGLWFWNDRTDRTASEVIEVLRAAAAIEQAREAETTPAPRSVLTSPALLEQAADKHGVPVVVVDGYYSAILYRPSGEAILWRAVVPESERVALGLAVA